MPDEQRLITTKDIENVLELFRRAKTELSMANDDLKYCDDKTQDYLHELELVNHTYHERGRIAKELAELRQKRRAAKDRIELVTPIVNWAIQYKSSIDGLQRVLGELRKIDARQSNRLYFYRADEKGKTIGA